VRVLVVHNRYRSSMPSGENAVVDQEVDLLRDRGLDVHLLTVESDEIAGWPVRRKALLPGRVIWSRDGAHLVRTRIDDVRPDVVHFHNTFPLLSPAALRAASGTGARVVKTLHNFRPLCPEGMFFRDGRVCEDCLGRTPLPAVRHGCYRGTRRATLPLAVADAVHDRAGTWRTAVDAYITPSAFARSRYVAAGWPEDRLVVKYNTAPDTPLRREGAGRGFVCLARLGAEKGVDVLLDAWSRAFPDGGEGLAIVGSGDLEDELRARARGMAGVEFCGRLSHADAMERLRAARAVVMPSVWYEVFPRTVVEAYAHAVPMVASRLGSLIEVVPDGESGLLFEPRDADALAGTLRRMAADDALCVRLGEGARRLYEARFAPAVTTDRLLAVYRGEPVAQPSQPRAEVAV
jgi:glycosyltransferase involved in cell wall biosynthesis